LEELKAQGCIREFENKKRRQKVVFGFDKNDPIENFFIRQAKEPTVKKKMVNMWKMVGF